MKKTLLLFFGAMLSTVAFAENLSSDLIISEYCEYNQTVSTPQYFNHYVEIYNGTGHDVDLSQYQLWRSFNANGWNNNAGTPVVPINLKGTLASGKTYVITRENLPATPISIEASSSQTCSYLNISGDDAIGLAKNDGTGNYIVIDIVGSETNDPGEGWTVAGIFNATQNRTLVRKPGICHPNTNWIQSAGTNADDSEWIVLAQNDISNIGFHGCDCGNLNVGNGDNKKLSALFIGNSYTYYNDMPKLVNTIANSVGDTLINAQSTPGGWFLEQHFSTDETLQLLSSQSYDFVVLQEQSQRPALDSLTTAYKFYKFAAKLDSIRKVFSPNGQTMYYMTWGRKFGDATNCATNPQVCTYEKMDSMLRVRYLYAQRETGSLISPVGAVRSYLIQNHPEIDLYTDDNSHPSQAGSYVSAMTFYTCMFRKDPTLTSYNYVLGQSVAAIIRDAVKEVVYNYLNSWNTYGEEKEVDIQIDIAQPEVNSQWEQYQSFLAQATVASPSSPITEVAFYLNGQLVKKLTQEPFTTTIPTDKSGNNSLMVIATNELGEKNTKSISFWVKAAPFVIPSRIEAEAYVDMFGIQNEVCSEGTFNIMYTDAGDWMTYEINVPKSGFYITHYRVASLTGIGRFKLQTGDGVSQLDDVAVPVTGGWQTWVTVTSRALLTAGVQTIRLYVTSTGFNINWFEFVADEATPVSELDGSDRSDELKLFPNPANTNLTVKLEEGDMMIEAYDLVGRRVYISYLDGAASTYTVSLQQLMSGVYVFKVFNKSSISRLQRVVVR